MTDALRVVVAEDSFLLRAGVVRVLEAAGFAIAGEAADAEELLEQVRAHRPDVAVTDIRMPPTNTDDGVRAALSGAKDRSTHVSEPRESLALPPDSLM